MSTTYHHRHHRYHRDGTTHNHIQGNKKLPPTALEILQNLEDLEEETKKSNSPSRNTCINSTVGTSTPPSHSSKSTPRNGATTSRSKVRRCKSTDPDSTNTRNKGSQLPSTYDDHDEKELKNKILQSLVLNPSPDNKKSKNESPSKLKSNHDKNHTMTSIRTKPPEEKGNGLVMIRASSSHDTNNQNEMMQKHVSKLRSLLNTAKNVNCTHEKSAIDVDTAVSNMKRIGNINLPNTPTVGSSISNTEKRSQTKLVQVQQIKKDNNTPKEECTIDTNQQYNHYNDLQQHSPFKLGPTTTISINSSPSPKSKILQEQSLPKSNLTSPATSLSSYVPSSPSTTTVSSSSSSSYQNCDSTHTTPIRKSSSRRCRKEDEKEIVPSSNNNRDVSDHDVQKQHGNDVKVLLDYQKISKDEGIIVNSTSSDNQDTSLEKSAVTKCHNVQIGTYAKSYKTKSNIRLPQLPSKNGMFDMIGDDVDDVSVCSSDSDSISCGGSSVSSDSSCIGGSSSSSCSGSSASSDSTSDSDFLTSDSSSTDDSDESSYHFHTDTRRISIPNIVENVSQPINEKRATQHNDADDDSTTTSSSSSHCESLCSESSSDDTSVSLGRLSLGSVGNIIGKALFDEDFNDDDYSDSGLSFGDIGDIGLTPTFDKMKNNSDESLMIKDSDQSLQNKLENQGQQDVLDFLYDLEEKNGFYDSDCSHSQSDDDLSHVSDDGILGENEAQDESANVDRALVQVELPSVPSSPPRVKRHHPKKSSKSSVESTDLEAMDDLTIARANSTNNHVQKAANDKSKKDTVNAEPKGPLRFTPKSPCALHNEGLSGIIRGDSILCILDSPGNSSSHRVRPNRARIIGKKRTLFGSPSSKANEKFSFCTHSVSQSIDIMRKLRADETVYDQKTIFDEFDDSLKSEVLGEKEDSITYSQICGSEDFPLISSQLETWVVDNLEKGDFEAAMSHLEQVLSNFANDLMHQQRFGENVQNTSENVGITLCNIGIVHLLSQKFDDALQVFKRSLEIQKTVKNNSKTNHCTTLAMIGLSCYAVEDFVSAKMYLKKALTSLRSQKDSDILLLAEITNNLGCINYETGHQMKAIKLFEESLGLQRKSVVTEVYENRKSLCKQMLMKIAVTQANIGYVHFEMKNNDAAIAAFETCQKYSDLILNDNHPFAYAIMDYTALAYLRKDNKNAAIKVYSKMLTAQIYAHEGGDNVFCSQTLIKLNMLQARRNDKKSIRACMKKVKEFIRDNTDPLQHERLQKLLKLNGVIFFLASK